jgi:transposase-like protein
MQDEEVKALAAELTAARTPGKRVRYSAASMQWAVRLYHQSGEAPSVFAQRIGVSEPALARWIAAGEDEAAFVPVRVVGEQPADENSAPPTAASPSATNFSPDQSQTLARELNAKTSGMVIVRETVVTLPADFDLGRIGEIVTALRGGQTC